VNKWYHRNCYRDFREGDHGKFVDSVLSLIKLAGDGELVRWGKGVDPKVIRGYARGYWGLLPAEELLKISMGFDSYDQISVIKELAARGGSTNTFAL